MMDIIGIYSRSKSAMNSVSSILRSVLGPLGVRVITAVIGAVHTPIHPLKGQRFRLARMEGSYYEQVFDRISDIRNGLAQPGSRDVNVVARSIISDIESGKNGVIWRGDAIFDQAGSWCGCCRMDFLRRW
ncbi:hypothetical protein QBC32DRAFT_332449 [Pseudoneurospora amorphoporcata]|uniref:Uncharacterized protein n=1 Tax=Pseudoneurospora amorphoporcata TaxID=241081 RepID=A0AAN6SJS6_9PEZI|nr:hypothetical protein QBC32DRAFT_332449 [Pseudoneurospora amorphoporcata]